MIHYANQEVLFLQKARIRYSLCSLIKLKFMKISAKFCERYKLLINYQNNCNIKDKIIKHAH